MGKFTYDGLSRPTTKEYEDNFNSIDWSSTKCMVGTLEEKQQYDAKVEAAAELAETYEVKVTISGIPSDRYEEICSDIENDIKMKGVECWFGVGEPEDSE